MGIILLFFGSFSFLTIIVTTLVLVISFAESLFFIFNWLAYWRDGMDPDKAVDATVKLVGPAIALTMLTTLVSFASLSLTPGQGIREFSIAGTHRLAAALRLPDDLPAAAAEDGDPARPQAAASARASC